MPILVREGDITQSSTEAIMVFVSPAGTYRGSVALALRELVGEPFEEAVRSLGEEPRMLKAEALPFKAVVLVADDGSRSLVNLLLSGFECADTWRFKSLSVPAVRLGLEAETGGSVESKLQDYMMAAREALSSAASLEEIRFVFFGDTEKARLLRQALQDPGVGALKAAVTSRRVVEKFRAEIAAFSGDGRKMALPETDAGPIQIVEIASGEILTRIDLGFKDESSRLDSLTFDQPGDRLLVGLRFGRRIAMYDCQNGSLAGEFTAPKHAVKGWMRSKASAFSEDGTLVSTGFGRWVGVWEVDSGKLVHDLPLPFPTDACPDYNMAAVDLRFSADNRFLYVGTADQLWARLDLQSGELLATDTDLPTTVGVAPTDQGVLWATEDGRIWPSGRQFESEAWSWGVDFCLSGNRFAAQAGELRSMLDKVEHWSVSGELLSVEEGRMAGYVAGVGPAVKTQGGLKLGGLTYLSSKPCPDWVANAHFITDGSRIWRQGNTQPILELFCNHLELTGTRLAAYHSDGKVELYDLAESLVPHEGEIPWPDGRAVLSADGRFLVVSTNEKVGLWTNRLECLWTREAPPQRTLTNILSDGTTLWYASPGAWPGSNYLILDPNGEQRRLLPVFDSRFSGVLDDRILLGRLGNRVEILSLRDGSLLEVLEGPGRRADIRHNKWFPELKIVWGEGRTDLTPVIHGGRRMWHFQRTSPDGSRVVVQSENGATILDERAEVLGRVDFYGSPLAAQFDSSGVRIFTDLGELYLWEPQMNRWSRPPAR